MKPDRLLLAAILVAALGASIATFTKDANPDRQFEIEFLDPGVAVFAFTFG